MGCSASVVGGIRVKRGFDGGRVWVSGEEAMPMAGDRPAVTQGACCSSQPGQHEKFFMK